MAKKKRVRKDSIGIAHFRGSGKCGRGGGDVVSQTEDKYTRETVSQKRPTEEKGAEKAGKGKSLARPPKSPIFSNDDDS